MASANNLEKQIKRHMIGRVHQFYAVTAPGLEEICARELVQLSDTIRLDAVTPGGVSFSGRLDDLLRGNLHLCTAGRLLMRLETFKATNFRQLRKKASMVAWNRYLPEGDLPQCSVTAHQSRLYHTQAVSEHLTGAIAEYWRARSVETQEETGQTLHVRIEQDTATLSLDSSGSNLYMRGIKSHSALAPLRETLAAGILSLAGYNPERPLIDPMCGAGTFSLEAALIAKRIAPGRHREFAFMKWPAFRPKRWHHLTTLADRSVQVHQHPLIFASDVDATACDRLQTAMEQFELADTMQVACRDFFALKPPMRGRDQLPPGLVVLNPPYGRRLKADQSLRHLYRRIGQKLNGDFKGWRAAVLLPQTDLICTLPLDSRPIRLMHGGLTLYLLVGTIR